MTSPWTPARVAQLTELWDEGLSAARIGALMGLSKNAIAGKVDRLCLPSRPAPINSRRQEALTRKESRAHATAAVACGGPQPNPNSEPIAQPTPQRACEWIEGEKGVGFALYADAPRCPATARPGSSYCAEHHRRCYYKPQPRRRVA